MAKEMTPKEQALDVIQRGYFGDEMTSEEVIYELDRIVRLIQECTHGENGEAK